MCKVLLFISNFFKKETAVSINVRDHGARGDGIADDTRAIQSAINLAIRLNNENGLCVVDFPSGTYKISQPLKLIRVVDGRYKFFTCELRGESNPYIKNKRPAIVATFNDKPAILMQAARSVVIDNLAITGTNVFALPTADQIINGTDDNYWNTTGTRSERYSPYTGICIDPYRNGLPPDGGYPGLEADYIGSTGSSSVVISNCNIEYFYCGISLTPNGVGQNCEDIRIDNLKLISNPVGISVGQDQNRNINVTNLKASGAKILLDGSLFGIGNGTIPNVTGANVNHIKYLFQTSGSWGDRVTLKNIYGELIASLGSAPDVRFPLHIQDSYFKFWDVPVDYHLYTSMPTTFTGCYLGFYNNKQYKISIYNGSNNLAFIGCSFDNFPMFRGNYGTSTAHPKFINCKNAYNGNDYYDDEIVQLHSSIKGKIPPFAKITDGFGTWGSRSNTNALSFQQSVFVNNGDGTGYFDHDRANQLQVGDYLVSMTSWNATLPDDTTFNARFMTMGRVTDIAGTTVILAQVPSIPSGTYNLESREATKHHRRTVGDITIGANVINNVALASAWSVGDRILGAGIPTGTHITAIAGNAMTLNQNAVATNTDVALYDAITILTNYRAPAAPTKGEWFINDYCENTSPIGGIMGWKCVQAGKPGVWVEQ